MAILPPKKGYEYSVGHNAVRLRNVSRVLWLKPLQQLESDSFLPINYLLRSPESHWKAEVSPAPKVESTFDVRVSNAVSDSIVQSFRFTNLGFRLQTGVFALFEMIGEWTEEWHNFDVYCQLRRLLRKSQEVFTEKNDSRLLRLPPEGSLTQRHLIWQQDPQSHTVMDPRLHDGEGTSSSRRRVS